MNKNITKYLAFGSSLAAFGFLFASVAHAVSVDTNYIPLTTLPGIIAKGTPTNPVAVIKGLYGLAIGVGSVIAVVMLIWAGFEYMYEESFGKKSEAKERIMNAFIGLGVILGSYILLRTVNPDLVNFDVTLQGGRGKLAGLTAAVQRLDTANRNAATALTNISQLNSDITALNNKAATINSQIKLIQDTQKQIDDLSKDINTPGQASQFQQDIADLQAKIDALPPLTDLQNQLKTINNTVQDKVVSRITYQTTADQQTAVSRIDENIMRQGLGTSAGDSQAANIQVNIQASQSGADQLFNSKLQELSTLDQSNPSVKQAVAQTTARKTAMDAEFAQQIQLNQVLNPQSVTGGTSVSGNIVSNIQTSTASSAAGLRAAGLNDEASALEARAKDRISALCAQQKIGC